MKSFGQDSITTENQNLTISRGCVSIVRFQVFIYFPMRSWLSECILADLVGVFTY